MQEPAAPRKKAAPADAQQDMTQHTFDRMLQVVSANDYTGLAPAGHDEEELRALEEELGGSPPSG
ncbi:MAG: hypothetical protein FWE77_01035 [Clostridia bacterium]|nr:hypothetical protein [Clostridia bacterium]